MKRVLACLTEVAGKLFPAYVLMVLALIVFVAPSLSYACKAELAGYGLIFLAIAAVLGVGISVLIFLVARSGILAALKSNRAFCVVTVVAGVVLFAIQIVIVRGAWFEPGWDLGYLLYPGSYSELGDYYSLYPNQAFLAILFRTLGKIGNFFGIESMILSCVLVGCFFVAVSVVLAAFVTKKLGGFTAGYCSLAMGFVLVGLSPWIMVPYSDTYAMVFVALSFWLYVYFDKGLARWPLIVFCCLIGYLIKPTCIFVLGGIVVVEILHWLQQDDRRKKYQALDKKGLIFNGVGVVIAILLVFSVSHFAKSHIGVDETKSFSVSHFLMMGLNEETEGIWSADDVRLSENCATPEERQSTNMEVWQKRINDLGVGGIAKLMVQKTLSNYNDGTFAWEQEGGFYWGNYGTNEALKSFYGIDEAGTDIVRTNLFAPYAQAIWFMVLLGIALLLFGGRLGKKEQVLSVSLLMLSVFLMIFECRARYLLLYLPFFVSLGVLGWRSVLARFSRRRITTLPDRP